MSWRVCSANPAASIDPLVGRFVYGDSTDAGDSDNRVTASRHLKACKPHGADSTFGRMEQGA